jgi:hypothetical protein
MMNNLIALTDFERTIIIAAIEVKDFPQIPLTPQFAKSSKKELQFIFLGRILGELYFKDNNGRADDAHRNWLMKLNPVGDIEIGAVPERFVPISASVLGYILAIKFSDNNSDNLLEIIRTYLRERDLQSESTISSEVVLFYGMFWSGLLNFDFTRYFHTSLSREVLLDIEKKAYCLTKNPDVKIFDDFTEEIANQWIKIKSEKGNVPGKRFSEYCKMHSGEVPKERTLHEVLAKTEPYNLRNKRVLIFFFTGNPELHYLETVLRCIRWVEYVFLVYLHPGAQEKDDSGIETGHYIGSIKKEFNEVFRNISFETTVKKMNNPDDREIINNLKAFMKNRCTENNFLFYSSAGKNEDDRISLWVGKAFSKTPVFDSSENYLFVH